MIHEGLLHHRGTTEPVGISKPGLILNGVEGGITSGARPRW